MLGARLALAALLVCALAGAACATIDDDRVAARTACYKDCMQRDGWDPVCVWNPRYPNPTPKGGGSFMYPNECTAKCASQYAKFAEARDLKVRYRAVLPDRCYLKVWQIYFASGDQSLSDPGCRTCPTKRSTRRPAFKDMPEEQCNLACSDRDGWNPICVEAGGKRYAFGNPCVARCSTKIFSPNPLFYTRLPSACKTLFLMGKTSPTCMRCPSGAPDPNLLPIDDDRVKAREYCYKYCDSSLGWAPVCVWNPKYPRPTTHGGGSSVWPNACMAECMEQYAKYAEYGDLQVRYKVTGLPTSCRTQRFNIWYIDATEPTASDRLRKQCTTCK